jgi:hypothetical protein
MRTMSVEFERFLDLIDNDEKSVESLYKEMDSRDKNMNILVLNSIVEELLDNRYSKYFWKGCFQKSNSEDGYMVLRLRKT